VHNEHTPVADEPISGRNCYNPNAVL